MGDTLIVIPRSAISTSFSRSGGAGGQNVNKVNTKAEIRFSLPSARWLEEEVKGRIRELYPAYVNAEDEVFITSQVHRSQEGNLEECFEKLARMLRKSATAPKVRQIRTGLSELTKSERREDKRHRSAVKERRKGGSSSFGDD
jgi:protein subunit release factor B